jgi:hypothetical protein
MRLHKNKMLLRLIGLFAIAAAGCQSADPIPVARAQNPVMPPSTACQKADSMWNDKIVPSRYDQLPPLTSPGIFDLAKLTMSSFSVKALAAEGDELEEGRRKLIHAFGAEARLRLVISPEAAGGYTGIFRSGAECVIGRFSLANKPAKDTSIPALALKIFIDGDQPSVNLHVMHSVDGQAGHNFFAQTFSNILPPAIAFPKRLLSSGFERSAVQFGAKDPNPGRLTLEHLAGTLPDGTHILDPHTPYRLLFKPTAPARALMQGASAEDDFRLKLAGLPVGQAVYDIYTLAEGEPAENARPLGQLVLAAPLMSSHYGDEKLFFRHNMAKK